MKIAIFLWILAMILFVIWNYGAHKNDPKE